jgi:hypothetical protein
LKAQWFTDPADRYLRVVQALPPPQTTEARGSDLDPETLFDVIQTASEPSAVVSELADHIATHSRLTSDEATSLVTSLATQHTTPQELAAAASQAAAPSVSAGVELSDPAMLGPLPRLLASAVLAAAVLMSVVFAHVLPAKSSSWAYATFMFIVAVGSIGILVLVMGYRNVTIKGSGK